MNLQDLLKYAVIGMLVGSFLAMFGIVRRQRQFMKQGILVPTTHLQKNSVLVDAIRKLRPFFQIGPVTMDPRYIYVVRSIDALVEAVLQKHHKQKVVHEALFLEPHFVRHLIDKINTDDPKDEPRKQVIHSVRCCVEELIASLKRSL
jgi:hypothetical protein